MKRIGLILGLVLIMNFSVSAQEETDSPNSEASSPRRTGWTITIEPVHANLYGADEHFGDIYSFYSIFLGTPRNQTFNYGVNYEPIVVELPSTNQTILGLSYQWSKWRFGIENGWHFKSSDDKSCLVSSDLINIRGVRMFGNTFRQPLLNEHNLPPLSDVWYWAENSIRIRTLKVYLDRKLNDIADVTLSIRGASILSRHNVGQNQWAFIDNSNTWYQFDNEVTLAQDSKARSWLIGPNIGLKFETKYLAGSFELGALVGETRQSGTWKDFDNIVITNKSTGEVFATAFYNGQFPFKQVERIAIPNTEFRIKLTQRENLSESTYLDFSLGVLVSTLWDVPIAPKWLIPGDWHWAEGTHWETQKRNLTLFGFTVGFEIGF